MSILKQPSIGTSSHKSHLGAGACCALTLMGLASQAKAEEHMLILLDRTGSMQTAAAGGGTRFDKAKALAVDAVLAVANNRRYALWTFSRASGSSVMYAPIVKFTDPESTSPTAVAVKIAGISVSSDLTPLAGTICDGVDYLVGYKPTELHTKRIGLFSDGLENYTPENHPCHGPDSADHSHPDVGSWEWKVFNKLRTGDPNSTVIPPTPLQIVVDADYIFDNEPLVYSAGFSTISSIVAPPKIDKIISPLIRSLQLEKVTIPVSISRSPAAELLKIQGFYQVLTHQNHGRYRQFTTDARLPQLGDLTGDYCVDYDDYDAIVDNFGQSVAPGSLLDPNQDGVVDIYDYQTMVQNWNEGC